ncbi:MAG: hypothetical protein HY889_00290, partial [Deltaproteobacteria bacterium]|nr:hypothetical protein [Deltaproteobacteria bacterium]
MKRPCRTKSLFIWAEAASGEKIGVLSLAAHDYSLNGARCTVGVLGDISVSKQWRGKGIAGRMFDYMAGLDAVKSMKACIVLPNDDAARALGKAGWQKVSKLERYVKVLRAEDLMRRVFGRGMLSRVFSLPVNAFLRLSDGSFPKGSDTRYKYGLASGFDDRFD